MHEALVQSACDCYNILLDMANNKLVLVEGYAACGKQFLATQAARYYNSNLSKPFITLDRGTFFRAAAYYLGKNGCNENTPEPDIKSKLATADIKYDYDKRGQKVLVFVNGENVSDKLDDQGEFAHLVPIFPKLSSVREYVQDLIIETIQNNNVILIGRALRQDFPDYSKFIWVEAHSKSRHYWRWLDRISTELGENLKGQQLSEKEIYDKTSATGISIQQSGKDVDSRDKMDAERSNHPLIRPSRLDAGVEFVDNYGSAERGIDKFVQSLKPVIESVENSIKTKKLVQIYNS